MAYEVVLKKRFLNKVQRVLSYLEKEWTAGVANDFLSKVNYHLDLLSKQPHIGAISTKEKDVRGLLITRHNKLYYTVKGSKVIILNMYDTRMNPKRNPYS